MRFGTLDGRAVIDAGHGFTDLQAASNGRFSSDPMAAFEVWEELMAWAREEGRSGRPASRPLETDTSQFGAPVPRPRQVFAVALNYAPHAAEAGFVPPDAPLVFTKFPSCIAPAHSWVTLPVGRVDWEAEMVVVVGRGGRNLDSSDGWDAIAGLCAGQDLSERASQMKGTPPQFSMGKSFAGFGPIGPTVVALDEIDHPDDLALSCTLNDEVVQSARTSEMIFSVPRLMAFLSATVALLPGDLIFTGTPAGVGNRRDPPRYLRPGDVLTTRLEGVGVLEQRFRSLETSP